MIVCTLNFFSIPLSVKALEESKSYIAIADSFIDEGDSDSSFGGFMYLNVGHRDSWKKAFLKFDLLNAPTNFYKAELRIGLLSVENNMLLEFYETNSGWSEYSITWNNAPSLGVFIASRYVSGVPYPQVYQQIEINITDNLVNITRYWSIGITSSFKWLSEIASKENAPVPTILYYYYTSDLLMVIKITLVELLGLVIIGVAIYNTRRVRLKKPRT